jgi:hypothetical protein
MKCLNIALRKPVDLSTASTHAAWMLGIAMAISPTWSHAATEVRGSPQAAVVDVQNAAIEKDIVALTDTFKVQFTSSASLDIRLAGTYEGTLPQAVSRIKGHNFLLKSGTAGLDITLLGTGEPVSAVGPRPAQLAATAAANIPQSATIGSADRSVTVAKSGGRAPPIRTAQAQPSVPTPPAAGATGPRPVPQIGSGATPVPTPAAPGAASPVPPLPTGSPAPNVTTPSTSRPPTPLPPSAPSP